MKHRPQPTHADLAWRQEDAFRALSEGLAQTEGVVDYRGDMQAGARLWQYADDPAEIVRQLSRIAGEGHDGHALIFHQEST